MYCIDLCVIKTVGCGTKHKCMNIQICSVKHYKCVTKTVLYIIFAHTVFVYIVKGVCM